MSITPSSCQFCIIYWNQCDNAFSRAHIWRCTRCKRISRRETLSCCCLFPPVYQLLQPPTSLHCAMHSTEMLLQCGSLPLRSVTVLESTNTCLDSSTPPSPSSHHQQDHLHHHWAQSCSKSWSPNSFDTCLNTCLRRNCVGTQDTKDLAGWSARHSLVKSMCIAWLNNI